MKRQIKIAVTVCIVAIGIGCYMKWHLRSRADAKVSSDRASPAQPVATSSIVPPRVNPPPGKRATDLTQTEREALAKKFDEKFRPAFFRWCSAYEDRIPFKREEFTLDKFHSMLGTHMYTFMIGDATVTLQDPGDSNKDAKVGYLMVRKAAVQMNQLPAPGFSPKLDLPISCEEVIRMVKADSGVEFKPNEVLMKPTAKACALNGGAFVDVLPAGADPNNALSFPISMVFDADGKLVNYERDPFF